MQVKPFADIFRQVVYRTGRSDLISRIRIREDEDTMRLNIELVSGAVISTRRPPAFFCLEGPPIDILVEGDRLQDFVLMAAGLEITNLHCSYSGEELGLDSNYLETAITAADGHGLDVEVDGAKVELPPALGLRSPATDRLQFNIQHRLLEFQWERHKARCALSVQLEEHEVEPAAGMLSAAFGKLFFSWLRAGSQPQLSHSAGWLHLTGGDLTLSLPYTAEELPQQETTAPVFRFRTDRSVIPIACAVGVVTMTVGEDLVVEEDRGKAVLPGKFIGEAAPGTQVQFQGDELFDIVGQAGSTLVLTVTDTEIHVSSNPEPGFRYTARMPALSVTQK